MYEKYEDRDLNYNFKKQVNPVKRMGQGEFANMPAQPKFLNYETKPHYRAGNINSLVADVQEVSDIFENRRQP